MTTITQLPSAPAQNPASFGTAFGFVMAAGIAGRMLNPLGAGQNAFGQLPSLWALSLLSSGRPQPEAQWTATTGTNGRASIDLGDGYSLQLNENNSEITITNAATGESTRIWGDPHVEVDGKHAFDFWGTTTFELANGTKITINTEQWGGNPNAYVASQLVITKGEQAIVVDGISQNQLGDLSITMGGDARAIDHAHRDGFLLEENRTGGGWRSAITGGVATQQDLNANAIGGAYGPGSQLPSVDELSALLGGFLLWGLFSGGNMFDRN